MIKSVNSRVDNKSIAGCHHHYHRSHLSVTVLHCWSFSVVQTFSWTVEHFSSAAAEQSCSLTVSATGGEFNLDLLSIIMQAASVTSPPHLTCGTFLFRDLLAAGAVAHTALGVRHSLALKIFHKNKISKIFSIIMSLSRGGRRAVLPAV